MRHTITPITQQLVNKINAKQNFTHNMRDTKKRYVVSITDIFKGKNPSLWFESNITIGNILNDKIKALSFDSIGGWLDSDGNYSVSLNKHYKGLDNAKSIAVINNQVAIFDLLEGIEIMI